MFSKNKISRWGKEGTPLLNDPIHGSIFLTYPTNSDEITEKDLIDSVWLQRLRQIHQLQSVWWVYPSAEHSRFQHVLGVMHLASKFAKALYPSLKEICGKDCPSENYIEELLRVAGLLHDVGHGPFGHFFDEFYLEPNFNITHEDIGAAIITDKLASRLRKLTCSPSGNFQKNERIVPDYLAFLIRKPRQSEADHQYPEWISILRTLFSGIYTIDNLDYVLRDSYMAGFTSAPAILDRLLYYSFFSERGLTLHKSGLNALRMFVELKKNLYDNVYFHRTSRAIDLHLRDIFSETIELIHKGNPVKNLDEYCKLTDWSLMVAVSSWDRSSNSKKKKLYKEWRFIMDRKIKWKMAYDKEFSLTISPEGVLKPIEPEELEQRIKKLLPKDKKNIQFRVDMPTHDPRPENPTLMKPDGLYVFDPVTGQVSNAALKSLFQAIPFKVIRCRVYTTSYEHKAVISKLVKQSLSKLGAAFETNV